MPFGHTSALVSSIAIVLQILLSAPNVAAQGSPRTLDEAEVIVRAKQQAPQILSANLAISLAEAKGRFSTQRLNPSLLWNREHLPGNGGDSEDTLVVSVPINLSNTRGVRQLLNRATVATLKSDAARTRSSVVEYALSELYQFLAQQEAQKELGRRVARLTKAAKIVSFRRESGKVSGYEQSRIEIELELAASALREGQARATRLSTSLALFLGLDPTVTSFSGSLASMRMLNASQSKDSLSLQWLRKAAIHSGQASRAAKKRWLPTLKLSGGLRRVMSDETRYGYMAGLSVSLPVFSGKEALRDRSMVEKRLGESRIAGIKTIQARKKRRAYLTMISARDEALLLSERTDSKLESIEKGTESGYREGQISLVELLDAQRLKSVVAERKLALDLGQKQAELAYRAASGEFE